MYLKIAQSVPLIYKREITLTLVYKYKINSIGKFKNQRKLIKVS
jgi:hypothetical protein